MPTYPKELGTPYLRALSYLIILHNFFFLSPFFPFLKCSAFLGGHITLNNVPSPNIKFFFCQFFENKANPEGEGHTQHKGT